MRTMAWLLGGLLVSTAMTTSAEETAGVGDGTVEVVAQLVSARRTFDCGTLAVGTPVRYLVLRGPADAADRSITVIVPCIEGATVDGKAGRFVPGAVHRLLLAPTPPDTRFEWTVDTDALADAHLWLRKASEAAPSDTDDVAPGTAIVADAEAPLRRLFGHAPGAVQSVPLRYVADAVAVGTAEERLADDRLAGAGGVPVTQAAVSDGHAAWAFVLAGGTLVAASVAPRYELLDALDVQTDPGGFPSLAAFALGPRPGVLVTNSHFNSQEGFAAHMLLALVAGRLTTLWEGPALYSVTSPDEDCPSRRIEQRLTRFAPVGAGPWPAIEVAFADTDACWFDDEPPRPDVRGFAATLVYDPVAARYVGALPELEKLNAERMCPEPDDCDDD